VIVLPSTKPWLTCAVVLIYTGQYGLPELQPRWSTVDVQPRYGCSIGATIYGMMCVMTTTIEELMQSAVDARRVAQNSIALAVREARAADWSWDRISAALGGSPNGETLRRNFSAGK
jgi:hypothetical protein